MTLRRTAGAGAWAAGLAAAACAAGCQTYRVEYHHRPSFYRNAMGGELPDRVQLDDGTVLVFTNQPGGAQAPDTDGGGGEPFRIREEMEDGTIVLRALLPQHVLANALTCIRNEEYELIWAQLLAEQTRRAYELREQGYEEFAEFMSTNRMELAATLTRLIMGLSRQESFMQNVGAGVIRFSFHPRISSQFKFKTAEVVSEGGGLRLKVIK